MKKIENSQKQYYASNNNARRPKWIYIVAAMVLLIALDLSPFGGNIKFYSTWLSCGQKPVEMGSGYLGAGALYYHEAKTFEPVRLGYSKYYCTPLEAEQAGLSSNPNRYEYKYLNK